MHVKRIKKNKKEFALSQSSGLTLIELVISITLLSILLTVTTSLYVTGLKVYNKEFKNNNLQDENRIIINRIVKEAKKSIGVADSEGAYTTNSTDTVILKVPSIDANGDYIFQGNGDFIFDYIIFTYSGTNLTKIVVPNGLSSRSSENKIICTKVESIGFTYAPDIPTAARLRVDLSLRENVGKEIIRVNTTSEIAFRNK